MISLIKAYWDLLVPSLPESQFVLSEEKVRKIVKEIARGNPSLQVGKYVTSSKRRIQKERIIKHSFV